MSKLKDGCVKPVAGPMLEDQERPSGNVPGIIQEVNLLVATQNNAGPISLSVKKAAKEFIKGDKVKEGLLNRVEMAFRAYDPCLSCATHALPGRIPLTLNIRNQEGTLIKTVMRG